MKEETLEEAMVRLSNVIGSSGISDKHSFMLGTFWQRERSYSEEDMLLAFETGRNFQLTGENNFKELIEQFKKK